MTVDSEKAQIDLAREADFTLGRIGVRPSTREIVIDGETQILEPRVMQVLVALACRRGKVVSRDELFRLCWQGRIVGDDAMNRCISQIRRLAPGQFKIDAIPRVGYRLTEIGASLATPVSVPTLLQTPWYRRYRTIFATVTGLAVLTLIAIGVAVYWPSRPPPKVVEVKAPVMPSVAVLPLTPADPGKDARSFADEVSTDIANTLSQTDLNVISPARSFQFRGDAKADAAKALHADVLVDGDVRRDGDMLVVSVRVEDVASGIVLLTKNIPRPAVQAADIPDQVATFLADAMGSDESINVLRPDRRWSPRVRTGLLRSVFQCRTVYGSLCGYEVGRDLVKLASDNAYAQLALAAGAVFALDSLPKREQPTTIATARNAAWAAIKLNPHYGAPYWVLGQLAPDLAASDAYYRRGLSVDPESQGPAVSLSGLLHSAGRCKDAFAIIQEAAARNPFTYWVPWTQLRILLQIGDTDGAVAIVKRARRLWPDYKHFIYPLFDAYAFQGKLTDAEALLNDPATGSFLQPPGAPQIYTHLVQALRTRRAQDIAVVSRDCAHFDADDWASSHSCIIGLTMLGRIDDVFRIPADVITPEVLFWPQTASLRADPRFVELTKKLGFFKYWKATRSRPDFCASEHVPVCQALAKKG